MRWLSSNCWKKIYSVSAIATALSCYKQSVTKWSNSFHNYYINLKCAIRSAVTQYFMRDVSLITKSLFNFIQLVLLYTSLSFCSARFRHKQKVTLMIMMMIRRFSTNKRDSSPHAFLLTLFTYTVHFTSHDSCHIVLGHSRRTWFCKWVFHYREYLRRNTFHLCVIDHVS